MKLIWVSLVLALALAVAGCSSISVSHDWDSGFAFAPLQSYDWLPIPVAAGANQLTVRRFKQAVDGALSAKGYQLSTDDPDFLIAVHTGTQQKIDVTDWGYGYGPYWGTRDISVQSYTEGQVILDFVDAESKNMFWRGMARGVVDPTPSPEKRDQRIQEAVDKLLRPFPPG